MSHVRVGQAALHSQLPAETAPDAHDMRRGALQTTTRHREAVANACVHGRRGPGRPRRRQPSGDTPGVQCVTSNRMPAGPRRDNAVT